MPSRRRTKASPQVTVKTTEWDPRLLQDEGITIEYVNIEDIQIDPTYQRALREAKIAKMIKDYDPRLMTAVVVSRREDGTLWAVDGQHRIEMLKRLGKSIVLADVRTGLSLKEEAYHFWHLNADTTSVGTWETFRARITAEDPDALRIEKIVNQNGYYLGRVQDGGINAVSALERLFNMGKLDKSLQILATVWPMDKTAREAAIIEGLGTFLLTWDVEPEWDDGRILEALDKISPSTILRDSQQKSAEKGRSPKANIPYSYMDAYNGRFVRGSKPSKKLKPKKIVRYSSGQQALYRG